MQENNQEPIIENNTDSVIDNNNEGSLDHHSAVEHEQQDDSHPLTEEEDVKTLTEAPSSGSTVAKKSSSNDDQGIPQWGRDDPEKWGKYKERKAQKEAEKQMHDLRRELEEVKRQQAYIPQQHVSDPDSEYKFNDPVTGMVLDARTEKGKQALLQFDLEQSRNEFRQEITKQTFQSYDVKKKQELAEQLEEAKYKYNDFKDVVEDNGHLYSQQIVDIASRLPNNGADFLYYLGKNPRELKKITSMPAHEQYEEILKHVIDYGSRGRRTSNAPDPIKPLPRSSDISGSGAGQDMASAKAIMKAKYCK